jgi:cysteine desulfurase family protein (TIGR01976 family)
MPLDLAAIRKQFPALDGEWTFLDNAGGSQILGRAVDAVVDFFRTSNVQLGGSYAPSQLAGARVAEGSRALARWLRCDADEIVVGGSTTQLLANLALAMSGQFTEGDEIIVTDADHESNIGAWRRIPGVVVKEWRVDADTLALRLEDLEELITKRTRLCCFTQASNIVGTVHDVAAVTRLCHERGVQVVVDGVAYAPHRRPEVRSWDVDYYVFSIYKIYGPHLAAIYGKRERLGALGGINHFFIDELPSKLQPGHVPYELMASLPPVTDYLESLDGAEVVAHETRLAARLLDYLGGVRGVRILGERTASAARVPTISFTVDGRHAGEVVRAVDTRRVGIKHGDFYARRLIDRLGLGPRGGVVRASMVHYNSVEEVDRLVAALEPALDPAFRPTGAP